MALSLFFINFADMRVARLLERHAGERRFSYEVLPPLKGSGTDGLFATIDRLQQYAPLYINITTHHSEYVYDELEERGVYVRRRIRRRPGTIAIAAAIKQRYEVEVIPHVICSGTSAEQTEYELLDLQFLGIENLLLLRGDKAKEDRVFRAEAGGHLHTTDLIDQVNRFNNGYFQDGTKMAVCGKPFHYGVAAYPEKHEEAPNLRQDMLYLKKKQEMGAEYAVTQLFYDNTKYFDFVRSARAMGISIPIIPGIKPLAKRAQLSMIPRTFHCDFPEALATEALKCKTDEDARQLGIEWAVAQCKELHENGVTNIHYYTMGALESVNDICKQLY